MLDDLSLLIKGSLQMGTKEVTDDPTHPDSAETVHISALALLKMLRHARSGVPLEVMGLMLGSFVDDYTINVVDVFAMPQSGTVSWLQDITRG
ncbi:Mov34/MPN/PAD-1 family protein [Ancylostoma caninum]|uniref:Mov34/MPN/PAD-1 family protein n=1 Tax=Ancylostoma caninum TaxID=29170 RepID=A0A368H5V5_ANCCA|nr:Mov34/MPN/PAD-1 family protein [Ancylostoma caninum]